ncbi:23S rRNA (guanosine(2251)-2'-O)-methyltransferase RlmB [Candidatus Pantoea carbekii]|uniref:RNA methyltransferase n=1 Tax=Candidatus Pantoea carbekii TaxID=1235990 RepID=U3U7L0_9GAMM|nr:23S rRNA Gm-2251 2-O-methyltransferase [Candidatus Pantoea carbekii]BAO00254.1 RNA methyltransferase [Candidatus Pantoea carbekii]
MAHIKMTKDYHENRLLELLESITNPLLLILDCITDPHNLGACLRCADAAGVHAVIVPKDRSAPINATVKKVSCGAADNVPFIRVTNLARTMRLLLAHNIWIIGTTEKASSTLYQSKLIGSIALVIGSESKGIRRLTREHCNQLISIPMLGKVSCLNVSVATGICLFEAIRQRNT